MQPSSLPPDSLASIEKHMVDVEHLLERHSIELAQLRDELNDLKRSSEWYSIQFSEMLRILARDMRELRATLICSVVSDGPISTHAMQALLRETADDARELKSPFQRVRLRGN